MIYDCLALSDKYEITYLEIDENHREIPASFDFYVFNYHHVRMDWLQVNSIAKLPGIKITFVLETLPNNPFVHCPYDIFDAYCTLDPTMDVRDKRVCAFPRPLETPQSIAPYKETSIPSIGTFGFATFGKGFDLVVDAVNKEFEEAVVRINIPYSQFASRGKSLLKKQDYADYLADVCKKTAKKGIRVEVTHDYMSKKELIDWCAQNTLNCFLYNRNQPGLSATTDQAISSGRPLAISDNETFRHIHPYIKPYPLQSLKESINSSQQQVSTIQKDWSPRRFMERFENVLAEDFIEACSP